jgi:hypothetical protein
MTRQQEYEQGLAEVIERQNLRIRDAIESLDQHELQFPTGCFPSAEYQRNQIKKKVVYLERQLVEFKKGTLPYDPNDHEFTMKNSDLISHACYLGHSREMTIN